MKYDVIIIGAGAAGLTAAVYTCRKKLLTAVISADVGGQTNLTNHIENYPGVNPMSGPNLMKKFAENARSFGAEFKVGKATKIEKAGDEFKIELGNGEKYEAKSLILAFGKVSRSLGIPGEAKFYGRGVSTCATCDAPMFKNKTAAVIGGGNSAVEAAEELSRIANKVYLVHRRDEFRADEITVERVSKIPNVEFVLSSIPVEITGEKLVDGLVVENVKTKEKKTLELNGVFVEIGFVVDTSMVADLVERNKMNEIIVNERGATSHEGIFAAGDVTQVPFKQTIISAGEGAKAALECYKYLTGGKGTSLDWDH